MTRWRVLLAGIGSALVLLALWWTPRSDVTPAWGQGVGIYTRATCTQISSAEPGKTFCFDQTANALRVWDGSFWRLITFATGTEPVALGSSPTQRFLVSIGGAATISGANSGAGLRVDPTLTAAPSQDLSIIDVGGTLTSLSGTHPMFAAINLNATGIAAGGGTVTDSAMLRIGGALGGASNSYAYLQEGGTMLLRGSAALRTATANQAMGTAPDTRALLILGGLTVGTSEAYTLLVAGDASPTLNNSAHQVRLTGTIHRANSGTHPMATTLTIEEPGFIGGTAPVTETATVWIRSVSPVGTDNYPLWIATSSQAPSGLAARFDGGLTINNASTMTSQGLGTLNVASASYLNNRAVLIASTASVNVTNILGLSASESRPNNLRGSCNFAAANTCTVQFGNNEPDAHYFVITSGLVNISGKARSGFLMTATTNNSNVVDYLIVR